MTTGNVSKRKRIDYKQLTSCKTILQGSQTFQKEPLILDRWSQERPRPVFSVSPHMCSNYSQLLNSSVLGLDGHLTSTERQRCLTSGLCMHYSQSGYLAQSCPKQSHRTPTSINAHAAILEDVLVKPEHKKKELAVSSLLQESTI